MAKFAPCNALLRSLSMADLDALEPDLKLFDLKTGATLYEMEDPVDWVYLPEIGLLSLITVLESGTALETSIVGREGGVGFIEALGSGTMFTRVIVQVPGQAYRVHAKAYHKAFDASATMRKAVHQQIELLQAESRQAIACHGVHAVKPRFNRWLLECQDLAGGMKRMPLKQEFLAVMLGVSRTTVTRIAMDAQKRGLLKYTRGSVEIIDRAGMEKGACECRASVQHLRRMLEPDSVLVAAPETPGETPKSRGHASRRSVDHPGASGRP
jgi:CRP-like cAMP-binding protein